jgi:hypothetical protein
MAFTASSSDIMDDLLAQFTSVFASSPGLPSSHHHNHYIHLLPDTVPVAVKPYRYMHHQKGELERQCADMLHQRIIQPSSLSFSAPVLLIKKADGSWWFCVDYRVLNSRTVKDKYPILVVEELLDELRGIAFFTKIDLRSGYHQVRMHPEDVEKTVFHTHEGLFEFLVMPFGLTNMSVTFQALMNDVLHPFLHRFVLVFFDDILIYSPNWTEHLRHVRMVFTKLQEHASSSSDPNAPSVIGKSRT